MVDNARDYEMATRKVLPGWGVVTTELYGRCLGVGIERLIDGEWVRNAWRVDDHSPDEIAATAKGWADGL